MHEMGTVASAWHADIVHDAIGSSSHPWSHMSNEQRAPGCLGYIGDEILPSYVGIIINHYKDPY